jgi:hypothetical protein
MFQTKINDHLYIDWSDYLNDSSDISENNYSDFIENILDQIKKNKELREAAAIKIQIWWRYLNYSPISIRCKIKLERNFKNLVDDLKS